MRIKKLKYSNFRNYEKEGVIEFDTTGKITIVYGKNGVGKTTMHQLFQWILYEKVAFNKTTSTNILYNLDAGERLKPGYQMRVCGQLEYEHEQKDYLVRREWVYEKNKSGKISHKLEYDEFYVQMFDDNGQPKKMDNPQLIIESTIPSGLSPYFFFDGETMIADLKVRGTESARMLKKALYTIFDLEAIEAAIKSIGSTKKSHTVLGELDDRRLKESEIIKKTNVDHTKNIVQIRKLKRRIDENQTIMEDAEKELEKFQEELQRISEKIGAQSSKRILENSRKSLQASNKQTEQTIILEQKAFGKEASEKYSYLLVAEVAKTAEERLYLEVQEEKKKIIPGLSKELLINLLTNDYCICGNPIHDKERAEYKRLKGFFPPSSYKATYDKYQRYIEKHTYSYDSERLLRYLKKIVELKAQIRETEEQIEEIDVEIKNSGNVDELIERRTELERKQIPELEKTIRKCNADIEYDQKQLNEREKRYVKTESANTEIEKYNNQIAFVENVLVALQERVKNDTEDYVNTLQRDIQFLLKTMLTSKREVSLSDDFQLQVKDNHGDESKSEGQFAVVSFAYIVGILKVLKSHEKLKNKEYPLVLDGPFSKLDEDQKRNVLNTIPKYVPQVIILTKDSLYDVLEKEEIGKEYTITSNEHKNNAIIKEGYLWN